MSKNRIKIKLPQISTREEAETAVGQIALAIINKTNLTSQMDEEVANARKKYEGNLTAIDADVEAKTEALRIWAEANPDAFPKGRKSLDFVQGTIGFRTGTPALALLNRKWNWDKVTKALQERLPAFLRDKPEMDKASLLAQRDEKIIAENLPLVGLKVTQDEGFFVEPKLTKVESRQVVETQKAA
jgi:phage host-nuclease inhibitor protein Gam